MHLRQPGLVDLAPGLIGVPVVGALIGIEGTEEPFASMTSRRPRKLLRVPSSSTKKAEELSLVASSTVTIRQIPLAAGHPFMGRPVLMQHQTWQRFAGPLLAVCPASRRTGDLAGGLQGLLRPRIRPRPPMLGLPALVDMLDGPPRVAGLIQHHHPQGFVHGHRAGRGPLHTGCSTDETSAPSRPASPRPPPSSIPAVVVVHTALQTACVSPPGAPSSGSSWALLEGPP